MIEAGSFVSAAAARGFSVYSGVPCSYLTPFINYTIGSGQLRYVAAANEGDAVAIAAGAELGGCGGVAMFQNSGLGNAVNPLTSLTWTFRIPILLIVTWRGEPGGHADEPQHELMGQITPRMLELMDIPWAFFPDSEAAIAPTLDAAVASMQASQRPHALVMRKGSVADSVLGGRLREPAALQPAAASRRPASARRQDMLAAIRAADSGQDVLVATTGYMGRELYALGDRANQLYMVGSMGCAVSLALGIALAQPRRRVIAIDGDGAALMRLGALSTVGYQRPDNLVHIVIDNGQHESTGGQATVSPHVDFCAIAAACGYPRVATASEPAGLAALLAAPAAGPLFIHVPVLPGVPANLPRPVITPAEVAARLRRHLQA
ncbi:MAG: phosphonopyruvate decarboxylase [Gammaproteobacteria bacterium]|jgi:phosphonopyruvate decarboxylase|nr:phosphonopyruvate decarboxylase [Gammaproteobacteria bacterium]